MCYSHRILPAFFLRTIPVLAKLPMQIQKTVLLSEICTFNIEHSQSRIYVCLIGFRLTTIIVMLSSPDIPNLHIFFLHMNMALICINHLRSFNQTSPLSERMRYELALKIPAKKK